MSWEGDEDQKSVVSEEEIRKVMLRHCKVPKRFLRLSIDDMDDTGRPGYRKTLQRVREIGAAFERGEAEDADLFFKGPFEFWSPV